MSRDERLYRNFMCGIFVVLGAVPILAAIDTGHLGYLIPTALAWGFAVLFWKFLTAIFSD